MNGWIKLHRKLLEDDVLMRSDNALKLFITILLLADKETGKWSGGRFQLASFAKLKNSSTYKALLRLKNLKMVSLDSNNKYSTITICKWNQYQNNSSTKEEQQSNNKVTTEEQQSSTLTRIKNIRTSTKVLERSTNNSNEDINKLIQYWTDVFGATKFTQKDRFALHNLLRAKYLETDMPGFTPIERVMKLIDIVRVISVDKFAPAVNSPVQMQLKYNDIKGYLRKKKGDNARVTKL